MQKQFVIIFCFLFISLASSQNEANIWYFGQNAGLDFNSGTPVALLDGQLDTEEGCATISDNTGSLLFYTDGSTVWNRNHQIMPNGNGLNGDSSSTQSAIIVPKPNDSNIYYIFTVDDVGGPDGLQYSEVDLSLDGGLGDITATKNILLETPVNEKLSAIKVNNSNEYWVVSHKWQSNEFITYRVTSAGINTTPIISAVGTFTGGNPLEITRTSGQLKISPDGTKLAVARTDDLSEAQIFDFDTNTGVVSNPITIYNDPMGDEKVYGIEFSPNSNLLYLSIINGDLFQFNLQAGSTQDIINSRIQLNNAEEIYGQLQLGPDGKIYIAVDFQEFLDVINNPDVVGLGCNYQAQVIDLGGRDCNLGLPPFIQSFFNVSFQSENYCLGDTTNFTLNNTQPYDTLQWDFGDGTTSTLENPTHQFLSSGDYTVTLTLTSGTETAIDTQIITINAQPTATQPQNILVCDDNNDGFYNFNLTNQDAAILNGQDANQFQVDYYASAADYTSNTPITDFNDYVNSVAYGLQEITASVKNNDNLDCEAITTFNIQVVESPLPSQMITPITTCDNTSFGTDTDGIVITDLTQREVDILNGQSPVDFTVSYYTDAAFTNQITTPSAYQNTNTNETIYVQVENVNSAGNCVADTSFQLQVNALPTTTPIVTLRQCDDDLDGFSVFNLREVYSELSANYQNETISFYESATEAENGTPQIPNETAYTNQTVSTDVVWARVESANGCYRTAQVNLTVSTTQIPLTFTRNFYACDDAVVGTDTDGISAFDFSSVTAEIEAIFPVGQQLVINYYHNQTDALAEENPITDISNYRNIGYPNSQDIYIRVDSLLDNDCLGLGEHITLTVETVPVANPVTIAEQCDADGDGLYPFDTSNIEASILQGQTNVSVSYTDALGNPLPSPLPNPFLSGTQNVTARVINTLSQDPNGACFDETILNFRVQAAAVAHPIADSMVCDDDTDGFFNFDTSAIEATLLNGQTGMLVSYTDGNGDALPSPLPNPFFSNTQTITARVENLLSSTCFDETTINFIVNEVPVANTIANHFVCDDASNDGEEFFILSDYDTQILGAQSSTTFEVFYFDNPADAMDINAIPLPDSYLVNSLATSIHARIQNRNNPSCFETTSFQLGVNVLPIAATPTDFDVCDDESNDGVENFVLSDKDSEILDGLNPSDFDIKYYLSMDDAIQDENQISDNFTNTESPQTIYVRLENVISPDCFTTTQFDIYVREQPVLVMDELWPICEGETVDVIADAGYDHYSWSNGEMTRIITVDEPQTLTVRAWNDYGNLICEAEKTITVTESNIATITNIETVDWTLSENSITIEVSGNGDYEYSIDGLAYQDSNVFGNLNADEYEVYVRDKLGCGTVSETVYLLNAPRFFTPNGDGNHDTWQIINGFTEPTNIIRIFDRYGKLLKQLSPTSQGWDGTYNGNIMPTSDYWFVVERENGRTYTGHFTLKR